MLPLNNVSNKTARLKLKDLLEKGLLDVKGKRRATKYIPKLR
jgi:Fic family protein